MTDARLTSLHACLRAEAGGAPVPADELAARMVALARGELRGAEREAAVAELARSPEAALAWRLARAATTGAEALSADIAALPGRQAPTVRRGLPAPLRWALAAGIAAAALLSVNALRQPAVDAGDAVATAPAAPEPEPLFSGSFEPREQVAHQGRRDEGSIFSGGFDGDS